MKAIVQHLRALTALALALPIGSAMAADLPTYNPSYPSPNSACATYGNFVSCSTGVLDYLVGKYPGFTGPYSFAASQGSLLDAIVVTTNTSNGGPGQNGDQVNPSENAFSSNNGGTKNYFMTGDPGKKGGTNDPANNGNLLGDTPYSWDLGLNALNQKLTINGIYHQMAIAFDFNNPQSGVPSLPFWALVTIRDVDGNKQNVYFETQALDLSDIFKDPTAYSSNKTFDGSGVTTPYASDFATTVGRICVVDDKVSYPSLDGTTCPQGGTIVDTNRASNEVEFMNYIPGLDLRALEQQGYDTMSVQIWMGCFNVAGDKTSGPALQDNGSIGPCDTGGFGDIFLVAGAEQGTQLPEPASLALTLLALGGVAVARRKVRQH